MSCVWGERGDVDNPEEFPHSGRQGFTTGQSDPTLSTKLCKWGWGRRCGAELFCCAWTTIPKLSRVAVLGTSTRPGNAQQLREIELAAGAFGVKLQYLDVL